MLRPYRSALRRAGLSVLTVFAALPAPGSGQQTAADLRPVTTVEGITEYRLDNGLRVLLFPDASKPQVTVNITYLVGSRHEGYGETGMAHLLEHMLFKGTPTHTDIIAGAHRARGPAQRHHLVRPDQLLRDLPGSRGRTSTGRSTWKPTAWSTPSSPRRTSTPR